MAKEVAKASRKKFYNLGVEETKTQLAGELTEVCRDYYKETWMEALNLAGVLAASEWRQARSVYYHLDIRKAPIAYLSPSTLTLESFEQPLTA